MVISSHLPVISFQGANLTRAHGRDGLVDGLLTVIRRLRSRNGGDRITGVTRYNNENEPISSYEKYTNVGYWYHDRSLLVDLSDKLIK